MMGMVRFCAARVALAKVGVLVLLPSTDVAASATSAAGTMLDRPVTER